MDQGNPPPTPEESVEQEAEVPEEPLQVPIVTQQPKPVVAEQPLPQVLPMPKPMPLPNAIPKVPDQPIPYQGLINPRPLDIRLLGTLQGYDEDDKDDKNQPEVSIRQPDKTMYRKSKKLFDEIQNEMIFRKHLPRQLEINFTIFTILGREDHSLLRTIKEALYIRANNPSLNRNIGKYHLPHIWDEVLLNISELNLKLTSGNNINHNWL